jgi:hypothetical protein
MKKFNRVVLAGAVATMALASVQASASEFEPKRNEVSFYGSIDSQSTNNGGGSQTVSTIFVSYGRYFMPQLVGTVNGFLMQSGSGNTKVQLQDVGVGAKYYFKVGKEGDWTPFVEGDLEASSTQTGGGTTYNGWGVGVAGGVTYWLTEVAGINLDARYKSDSFSINGQTITTTHTMAEAGLTVKF